MLFSNQRATTVYDKAHERFRQLSLKEKHEFYNKLAEYYKIEELKEG